jgi:hypothetical protein
MRKKIILITILFVYIQNAYSAKIYSRTTSNGGPNGYNSVSRLHYEIVLPIPFVDSDYWPVLDYTSITCNGPGNEDCPQTIAYSPDQNYDQVDVNFINTLVKIADNNIEASNNNGTYTSNVQVFNETFLRKYTVTWHFVNNQYLVEIDRTNVQK